MRRLLALVLAVPIVASAGNFITGGAATDKIPARSLGATDPRTVVRANDLNDIKRHTEGWVNVKSSAYGAKGDDVSNDTTALQAAINALTKGSTLVLPPGRYHVTSTLTFTTKQGIRVLGSSGHGQSADDGSSRTTIVWDGAAGGTVMVLDRVRDSLFSGFHIVAGAHTPAVGLNMDDLTPPTGNQGTTNNILEKIGILTGSTAGLKFCGAAPAGCSELTFRDLYILNVGTYNVYAPSSTGQVKAVHFEGGAIAGGTSYGFYATSIGLDINGTEFSTPDATNIHVTNPCNPLHVRDVTSELGARFLVAGGGSGSSYVVLLEANSFSPDHAAEDGIIVDYKHMGPLVLIGNDFSAGQVNASVRIKVADGTLRSLGNAYPNATPFLVTGTSDHSSSGDNYTDGDGYGHVIPSAGLVSVTGISGTAAAAKNLRGRCTLNYASGGDHATCTFPVAEPDDGYYLTVSLSDTYGFTATAANVTLAAIIKNPDGTGFAIWLQGGAGRPNDGSFIKYDWHLIR